MEMNNKYISTEAFQTDEKGLFWLLFWLGVYFVYIKLDNNELIKAVAEIFSVKMVFVYVKKKG